MNSVFIVSAAKKIKKLKGFSLSGNCDSDCGAGFLITTLPCINMSGRWLVVRGTDWLSGFLQSAPDRAALATTTSVNVVWKENWFDKKNFRKLKVAT